MRASHKKKRRQRAHFTRAKHARRQLKLKPRASTENKKRPARFLHRTKYIYFSLCRRRRRRASATRGFGFDRRMCARLLRPEPSTHKHAHTTHRCPLLCGYDVRVRCANYVRKWERTLLIETFASAHTKSEYRRRRSILYMVYVCARVFAQCLCACCCVCTTSCGLFHAASENQSQAGRARVCACELRTDMFAVCVCTQRSHIVRRWAFTIALAPRSRAHTRRKNNIM